MVARLAADGVRENAALDQDVFVLLDAGSAVVPMSRPLEEHE